MSATSVSGVYTPSRFHKEGSRSLRRDAKIHQNFWHIRPQKRLCISPARSQNWTERPQDSSGPSIRPVGSASARSATAGPENQNCQPTGHASAAAPRRIDGAARRDAGRAAGRHRTALPRRVGAQRLAGADLRPPAPELRAPLPRGPDGPQPQVRHRPRRVLALGLVCLPRSFGHSTAEFAEVSVTSFQAPRSMVTILYAPLYGCFRSPFMIISTRISP